MADLVGEMEVRIGADISGFTGGIDKVMGKMNSLAGYLGSFAGFAFLAKAAHEAMITEDNFAQLNAVLKSTKGAAGITAQAATGLADSLSKVTRFSDDSILKAENLALTFTRISKTTFPGAIEAALNMSQAMGQDLKSSIIQVSKALNDPLKGFTALQRVGVTFSNQQKQLIKQFMATNQIAKAQAVVLGELNVEFGSVARAAGETAAGSLQILENKFGQFMKGVGSSFLPIIRTLAQA